jgi:NTE family protein
MARREQTDILLQPPLENVDLLDWRAFERAIDAGYRHALQRLAAADAAPDVSPPAANPIEPQQLRAR